MTTNSDDEERIILPFGEEIEPDTKMQPLDKPNSGNAMEIAKVSVKMPPFFRKNVKTWFWQVEAQFANSHITSEVTKYYYVVGSLDSDVAELVADLMDKPLSATPYADLKERLLTEFGETEVRRTKKLLNELQLGDRRPSALLREMRSLAGTNIRDEFLKTMFLDRLPEATKTILAASTGEKLDSLAEMADRILEVTSNQYLCSASASSPPTPTVNKAPISDVESRLSRLETLIQELTVNISELNTRGRPYSRSQSPYPRSRSNSRHRGECWYHFTFKEDARKCVKPCSFKPSNPDQQKNH